MILLPSEEFSDDLLAIDSQIEKIKEQRKAAGMSPMTLADEVAFRHEILEARHSKMFSDEYAKSLKSAPKLEDLLASKSRQFLPAPLTRHIGLADDVAARSGDAVDGVKMLTGLGGAIGLAGLAGLEALRNRKNSLVEQAAEGAAKLGKIEGDDAKALTTRIKETVDKTKGALKNAGEKIAQSAVGKAGAKVAGVAGKTLDKAAHYADVQGRAIDAGEWLATRAGVPSSVLGPTVAGLNRSVGVHPVTVGLDLIPTPAFSRPLVPVRDDLGNFVYDENGDVRLQPGDYEWYDKGAYWKMIETRNDPNASWQEKAIYGDPYGGEMAGNFIGELMYGQGSLSERAQRARDAARNVAEDPMYKALKEMQTDRKWSLYGKMDLIPGWRDTIENYVTDKSGEEELQGSDAYSLWRSASEEQGSPVKLPALRESEK